MKIVKFLKPWRAYTEGELAGFDDAVAKELIEKKVAVEQAAKDKKDDSKKD